MNRKHEISWVLERLFEFKAELQDLNILMIGCYISLHETIYPLKKRNQKSTSKRSLNDLLKSYDYDHKTRERMEKFLRAQHNSEYPLMYRLWTMMLWSIFESFIKNFLIEWIRRYPEIIQKLPVDPNKYNALKGNARFEYIIDATEHQLKHKFGIGVNRFETLLKPFGLSNEVDEDLSNKILELQQVRHVLVHRKGIVDKKLIKRCPWITSRPGEVIFIDSEIYDMYFDAVVKYSTEIVIRADFALDRMKDQKQLLQNNSK